MLRLLIVIIIGKWAGSFMLARNIGFIFAYRDKWDVSFLYERQFIKHVSGKFLLPHIQHTLSRHFVSGYADSLETEAPLLFCTGRISTCPAGPPHDT